MIKHVVLTFECSKTQTGFGDGLGANVNIPFPGSIGDPEAFLAWEAVVRLRVWHGAINR